MTVYGELSEQTQVETMLDSALEQAGAIDIVYNNAAIMTPWRKDPWDIPAEDFRKSFEVNVISLARICYRLVPLMLARKWGRVVNVTSGIMDQPNLTAYAVSKAAVDKFVRDFAPHLAGSGVQMDSSIRVGCAPIWADPKPRTIRRRCCPVPSCRYCSTMASAAACSAPKTMRARACRRLWKMPGANNRSFMRNWESETSVNSARVTALSGSIEPRHLRVDQVKSGQQRRRYRHPNACSKTPSTVEAPNDHLNENAHGRHTPVNDHVGGSSPAKDKMANQVLHAKHSPHHTADDGEPFQRFLHPTFLRPRAGVTSDGYSGL